MRLPLLLLALAALGPVAPRPAHAQDFELLDPATLQMIETAQQAEARQDWKRAAQAWKLVLGRDPAYTDASLGLARCLRAQGELAAARRIYQRLPAEPEAVAALAELIAAEDPAQAAALYQRLTQLRLGDPEAQRLYVRALLAVDPRRAAEELSLYLALAEGRPDDRLLVDIALALRERGEEEAGKALLERYLRDWPEGALADEVRGRLDRMAVEAAARELAVGPSQPLTAEQRATVERARRRAAAGQGEAALEELRALIQQAPQAAEAWGALGDVHAGQDRVEEAERAYARAASLAPEEAAWPARLGLLLARRYAGRRHAEADELLSRALALRPAWSELRLRLGEVRRERGDVAGAIRAFEEVLEAAPDGAEAAQARAALADLRRAVPPPAQSPPRLEPPPGLPEAALERYRIARVYFDKGQLAPCREELRAALDQAPDWPAALNLLAALDMLEGREESALRTWQRSLEVEPAQPLVRLNLGQRLRAAGRDEEARALLQQAAEGGAEDAWYLLGEMAWQEGRLLPARALLERYLASSAGGLHHEAALGLHARVLRRIRLLQGGAAAGAVGLALIGLGLLWRRLSAATLDELVLRAPEASTDLARLLSAIRHEVLKHNTTLLDEVALALERGDHHAVRWAAARLYGDERGAEGILSRFDAYLSAIARLGRGHGLRLDLRRRDPLLAPMHQAMRRLRRLAPDLRRPQRAGRGVPEELRRLSRQLNVESYRALGERVGRLGALRLDAALIEAVDARVRAEPAFAGRELPPLDLRMPEEEPVVRAFRGELEDVLANLLRNALGAVLEAPGAGRRGLWVEDEVDLVTGIESVRLLVLDDAPGRLSTEMILGRERGRGLNLVAELVARQEGSIGVEEPPAEARGLYSKAVVVSLRRAETS